MQKKTIKRILFSSLVLAFAGLRYGSSTFSVAQAANNLVLNPSFETAGSGGSGDAADWTEGTNHARSSGKFVGGSWALQSTFLGDHTSTRTTALIAVSPNTIYTLSAYLWKSATNPGSGACLDMNDISGELQLCATTTGSWQFKSGTWNSGSNTGIRLRLITDGSPNAGSWFDDISLTPLTAGPTPTATETPTVTDTPTVADTPTPCLDCLTSTPAPVGDTVTVAGAGDIACGSASTGAACNQMDTSDVLLSLNPDVVLAFGDTQYESGALHDFQNSWDPSWGRLKARLRPAVGNHEYLTSGAAGYFDYFDGVGNQNGPAGERGQGYYSYDLGNWHLIAANSNCSSIGGCDVGSPEYTWLQNDLAQAAQACTLIYMHHPFASSDTRNFDTAPPYQPLLQLFYAAGGELLLVGHSHFYERFARMDANKNADPTYGFREIVVGTARELEGNRVRLEEVNWLADPLPPGEDCTVQLRYRARAVPATVHSADGAALDLVLGEPVRAITPGQSGVLYGSDQRVLGGGVIA